MINLWQGSGLVSMLLCNPARHRSQTSTDRFKDVRLPFRSLSFLTPTTLARPSLRMDSPPSATLLAYHCIIPIELRREIILFCDSSTRAMCCLVSHSFLDICAPLLYKDICVSSVEQLGQLFCQRVRRFSSGVLLLDHP